jgi:hypothetical protein
MVGMVAAVMAAVLAKPWQAPVSPVLALGMPRRADLAGHPSATWLAAGERKFKACRRLAFASEIQNVVAEISKGALRRRRQKAAACGGTQGV